MLTLHTKQIEMHLSEVITIYYVIPNELYHHGVKGQKWGVRRYQNPDGTLTAKGLKRHQQGRLKLKSGYAVDSNGKVVYETNKNGKMTKAAGRAWFKYDSEYSSMANDELDFWDEYDKTDAGKNRLAEYNKQSNKMFNEDHWDADEKAQKRFYKAEEAYLRGAKEYAAKQLVAKYGQEKADLYANQGDVDTGKDAVKALSDEWWTHAI